MSQYNRSHRSKRRILIRARAAVMRDAMSPAESAFWRAVRGRRLGVSFRRQYVIGDFITDFCVPSAHLVVEIDGSGHHGRETADPRRDRVLARAGFRVLRVSNRAVERDLSAVLAAVRAALAVP